MARRYKIKRSKRNDSGTYRARPHPLTIILTVAVLAGLVYLGIIIYPVVYDFIMRIGSERGESSVSSQVLPPPESIASEERAEPESIESEPEPPAPPKQVTGLRMAYMPLASARSISAAEAFIAALPPEVNSVMLDLKDNQGNIFYNSGNAQAAAWGGITENPIDLAALTAMLEENGIALAARIHAFSDPICAKGDRDNAIKYNGTETLWLDNFANMGGKPWANPYSQPVREYLTDICLEIADMGAGMIVLDSVIFPDDTTGTATFGPAAQGISRGDILKTFMAEVDAALEPKGTRTALLIQATAINHIRADTRYGGSPVEIAGNDIIVSILPESLATGYLAEGVIITRPAADPAATVREVLAYADSFAREGQNIIPLVQGNSGGAAGMTAERINSQLDAAAESGAEEYILYSTDGVYPRESNLTD